MSEEITYTWKFALFTAIVLTFCSVIIFSVNASGYKNPQWENFGMIVIPSLWMLSFFPLIIPKINFKRKNGE